MELAKLFARIREIGWNYDNFSAFRVSTIDCGETVANWLEKVLEVPGCRLQVAAESESAIFF